MRAWPAAAWTIAAAVAVLWPSRFIGVLDGAPLDGRVEAVVAGLVLPCAWWLVPNRTGLRSLRVLIVLLLAWKATTGMIATQQGLCAVASAPQPLAGDAMTIRIDEPAGLLRSWDVRADLWAERPACTAILTRGLPALQDFPAWYLNITDQILKKRDFTIAVKGWATMAGPATLTFDVGRDVQLSGTVNGAPIGSQTALVAGANAIDLSLAVTGEAWRFEPMVNGRSLFDAATVTTGPPGTIDRFMAPWAWIVAPMFCLAIAGVLVWQGLSRFASSPMILAWLAAAIAASIALAFAPASWPRAAGALTLAAAAIPLATRSRNLRGAFVLLGAPWLAFFAAISIAQIGRFSIYSTDDWLAYQVAGYRIVMNGRWIEAGTPAFDYQPLYRWMTGALHLVFGDSSVGEVYWDAGCLLMGALLAFQLARMAAGFRWGVIAGAATLATFTLGTPWYFIGRGLSEIAAAGWAFLAMFFLLRARRGDARWIAAATVAAVLMFYSRLNHLLWAVTLPVLLLPLSVPTAFRAIARAASRIHRRHLVIYFGGFAAALLVFMLRTWYFTGVFALFYGTSLRHNDTGLRPWTLFNGEVWAKVSHSLYSFVWMNEPAHPDPRAAIMAAGFLVGVLALLQVPVARRVPGALVLAAAGATVGAFFAHGHGYPGRFSIHAVPLASALAMTAASKGWRA